MGTSRFRSSTFSVRRSTLGPPQARTVRHDVHSIADGELAIPDVGVKYR
jgi:hypothetical protein